MFRKTSVHRGLWIVAAYSIYDFLTNLGLIYLSHQPSRVFLYSLFTFVEFLLFAWILFSFINGQKFKKFIVGASIAFTAFLIIYNFYSTVRGIDSVPIGVETILIMVFAFYYFFEQMNDTSNMFIYSKFSFWIVLGMLVYLAGSFFIYIFASQLPQAEVQKYWIFTNIFSLLKNILFSIAMIMVSSPAPKKATGYSVYHLN